jgi:hypothetical protein
VERVTEREWWGDGAVGGREERGVLVADALTPAGHTVEPCECGLSGEGEGVVRLCMCVRGWKAHHPHRHSYLQEVKCPEASPQQ